MIGHEIVTVALMHDSCLFASSYIAELCLFPAVEHVNLRIEQATLPLSLTTSAYVMFSISFR